jgi:predicted dehydrogenase
MTNRRAFLMGSGLTAALARSAMGANDRIRMGLIGSGNRGRQVAAAMAINPDCEFAAVCDVFKPNLEKGVSALAGNPEGYVDYRRVLERKDIDGVIIGTPDHWHPQMVIDSVQSGKDAYCEKPASNSIEAAQKAVAVVKASDRIVEIGLQQRSWEHFQMCAKWVQSGQFGTIYHCALHWQGNYTRAVEAPSDPPPDLDWELFQGPAPRKPYVVSRQKSWRSWYDYGGGIVTDQGVHVADLVHWYMGAREPRQVTASAQWVRAQPTTEMPADTWAITWQYDNFVMTFANVFMPNSEYDAGSGNYFYGSAGALHVNRTSYQTKRIVARPRPGEAPAPPPAFDDVTKSFPYEGGPSDKAHARDFLDCVKSRKQPITSYETGFYSSLPLLLGVLAIRTGKSYRWDGSKTVVLS